MNHPDNLMYTSEHEWVKIENNIATVGITDFAQGELGDIIFLEFPDVDETVYSGKKKISYKARDGLTIEGYLTLPVGYKEGDKLPTIVFPHGGPMARDYAGFDYWTALLAYNGYAVLQPNFRGSSGYGHEFEMAAVQGFGKEMQDDLQDAANWLVEEGIANKDKICIGGATYGGYAALQSVIREPDLYQCTIGFVGVYDLDMMLEKGDIPENQAGINYLNQVLPTGGERDLQSPVKNVDKIKVPVFIIQGEEDERVPKEHAFALRAELEKRDMPYEWMMKSGEGHGFYKPENNIERWEAMIKFLDKHTQ